MSDNVIITPNIVKVCMCILEMKQKEFSKATGISEDALRYYLKGNRKTYYSTKINIQYYLDSKLDINELIRYIRWFVKK